MESADAGMPARVGGRRCQCDRPAEADRAGGLLLAGASVRRVEDITEALWGTRVSPGTVSALNQQVCVRIETWRNRPWGGEVRSVAVRVARAVAWEK